MGRVGDPRLRDTQPGFAENAYLSPGGHTWKILLHLVIEAFNRELVRVAWPTIILQRGEGVGGPSTQRYR